MKRRIVAIECRAVAEWPFGTAFGPGSPGATEAGQFACSRCRIRSEARTPSRMTSMICSFKQVGPSSQGLWFGFGSLLVNFICNSSKWCERSTRHTTYTHGTRQPIVREFCKSIRFRLVEVEKTRTSISYRSADLTYSASVYLHDLPVCLPVFMNSFGRPLL
eukprot:scaffold90345_cov32-Prasinocladus_malaysianus.AAC.1